MRNYNMKTEKSRKSWVQKYLSTLVLSGLVLTLLLLSACSSITGGANTAGNSGQTGAIAIPTIDQTLKNQGDTQLQSFHQWIGLVKQYGGDTTTYQQQYDADQQALQKATTSTNYKNALSTLNTQVAAIQMPTMKIEDQKLQQKLQQEVNTWGQQHQYHNPSDNIDYPLGFEYAANGIGSWAQDDLTSAKTIADYQQAIENLNMYLTNFQALMDNTKDSSPYNQVHQTDLKLMQHYAKMNDKVIVVSLEEQTMRVYDNGKLVNSFLVTTGRPDRPTPPGVWWVEGKKSPTVFKAGVPKSSPNWYPDTPINYAMQFHSEGYFIHDSWWRVNYGPGTNFPHTDASGDPFSAQGSHGCVNISTVNAGWVYGFVKLYTDIIIY
jgi:hypothetical protein